MIPVTLANNDVFQSLPSQSGLFFKEEGTLFPTHESWKLIVYRDLRPLFIAKESLNRLAAKFHSVSIRYYNFTNIQSIKSFLKINLDKIDERLSELNMYLGQNTRQKREIIDGLSSVLKWLIGTPDARDAKHYESCIDKLEKRELDMTNLMKKQIQITSSTIKNFNDTIFKISYDEQIINENIERLNEYMNSTTKTILNIRASEEISAISLQILELVISLEGEINDCITSILFAKSNAIHPSIISLRELHEQLLQSNHIRSNSRLVTPITINNLHTILESSTLSAYVYSNRLVYIIEFPLVQNDPLTLYHIYSIPMKHPNSSYYSTILPEHTYLATNPSGEQYVSTSSMENCKTYATGRRVCTDLIVYDADTRPICEIQILLSTIPKLPKICTTSTFPAEINTFQSLSNNHWLYILSQQTQCVLHCENQVSHHNLHGAGIVSLPQGCKLHTGQTTLVAYQTNENNISFPIIIPDIRTDDCFEEYKDLKTEKLIPIAINEMPLDSLNKIKHHIDKYSEELNKMKSTSFLEKNTETFAWLYFAIALILIAYFMLKCCKLYPNGLIGFPRRRRRNSNCIQIFNNCFDTSTRRHSNQIAIPMSTIAQPTTTCITDDDDDVPPQAVPSSPRSTSSRSGTNAQSLF